MDAQSISSHGYDAKENYLQQSDYYSIDTGRIDGLKNTSLSVLNSKKTHKTQIQKQFQQYQQHQLNQQRQSQFKPGPYQQQQQQQQQQQYPANSQYFNSMPPPSMRPPGAMSMQSLNSIGSSNYSQGGGYPQQYQQPQQPNYSQYSVSQQQYPNHVPQMLPQGEWSSGRMSPTKSPSLRLNSLSSNSQFPPPQQEYKSISPVLSQGEWDKPFQDERIKELELENEKLMDQNDELRNLNKTNSEIQAENDQLQSQLDSIKLELNKLKLEHNSMKETHKTEIKKLKDHNSELQNNLENMSFLNEKSTETTPNGSPKTVSKEYEHSVIDPSVSTTATAATSSKNLQQAQSNLENNELIQDLLETIKHLKTGNHILKNQNEELMDRMTKDKKYMKKLINSSRYQTKIRKGFNVLESVDTFI